MNKLEREKIKLEIRKLKREKWQSQADLYMKLIAIVIALGTLIKRGGFEWLAL